MPESFDEFARTKTPIEGRFGVFEASDGAIVSFIQCDCSEEAVIQRMLDCEPDEPPNKEYQRRLTRIARQDGFRVRKELGDRLENLGRRVNRLPSNCHHW